MNIWRLRRKKLNNMGMSLVEIIVAMAVLMIVTVPILYTFVYSANFNARARLRQQTTAAAQTVMENLKAYSVEDICKIFNEDSLKFPVNGNDSSAYEELIVSGVTFTPEGVPVYSGGEISLQISGMVYQRQTYDVDIKLTGHGSQASQIDFLKYESYAPENAASYAVSNAAMDSDALWAIMGIVAQKWNDKENVATHSASEVDAGKITITERELRVDIDQEGSDCVAKVSCVYTFEAGEYPYEDAATGTSGTFSIPEAGDPLDSNIYRVDLAESGGVDLSKEIFRQSTPLEYLYLYYYPAYNYIPGVVSNDPGAPVKVGRDQIVIDNTTGTEIACYIYKQKNLSISDAKLNTSESMYEVHISLTNACIYDDNLTTILGGDGNTTIPTNRIDITPSDKRYRGIGYAAAETKYPNADNHFSPAIPDSMSTETVTENQQIMYDVEIILSDSETGKQLGTLTGTIVE